MIKTVSSYLGYVNNLKLYVDFEKFIFSLCYFYLTNFTLKYCVNNNFSLKFYILKEIKNKTCLHYLPCLSI